MNSQQVELYLENICNQIASQEVAKEVYMEMKDHIESIAKDYMDKGISENEAIEKALYSMGNPKKIGLSLNNTHEGKKNKGFIIMMSIFVINLISLIAILINSRVNTGDRVFASLFTGLIIWEIVVLIKVNKKVKSIEEDPIMVIKSKKMTSKQDLLIVFIVFVLNIVITAVIFINASNTGYMFDYVWLMPILLSYYARTRPSTIYPSGIVTFNSFISWKEINSRVFTGNYTTKKPFHNIKLIKNKGWQALTIKVPDEQVRAVSQIINEKIS